MKHLRNENGQLFLVTVILISAAILTSLSMTYIYSSNRLKYHARIKESYKLVNAVETAAKIVKADWDQFFGPFYLAQCGQTGYNNCASSADRRAAISQALQNTVHPQNFTLPPPNPAPNPACPAQSIWVANPDNANNPYCFSYASGGKVFSEFHLRLQDKYADIKLNRFQKFAAKLDRFFEKMPEPGAKEDGVEIGSLRKPSFFGWLISEKTALAAVPNGTASIPVGPTCNYSPSGSPAAGCIQCHMNNGGQMASGCTVVSVCPSAWSSCQTGGTGAGITTAFKIQFDPTIL